MAEDQRSSHDVVVEALHNLGLVEDREKVQAETRLTEDLAMDSLDTVEFVLEIEEELDLIILDEEFKDWRTVQDVVERLDKIREI